jgi:TatD DNase family protein
MLIDTHCHIHEADYPLNVDEVIARAHQAGVMQMICVGTDGASSRRAIEFAHNNEGTFAAVGVHPHDAKGGLQELGRLIDTSDPSIVAIGEIGLDYYYDHSPRDVQIQMLETQIELALEHDLPIIFHVREAFDDFWPVLDNFHGIRGVLHSFTDTSDNISKGLKRGLLIGINGFSTFTKDELQREMFASLPLDKMLLETDAPFLTPTPFRGRINEPAFVRSIAEYHSVIRRISLGEIADTTTTNARALFRLQTD